MMRWGIILVKVLLLSVFLEGVNNSQKVCDATLTASSAR